MFSSFLSAGFDCTVGRNAAGERIDNLRATRHSSQLDDDFARLRAIGITTVRDGVPWPAIERRPGRYDWTAFDRLVDTAEKREIEVIYDFCHFGYPEHLDVFSDGFVRAFANFCYEAALRLGRRSPGPHFITPINEPSYFAWAAGEAARFFPYCFGRAREMKVQLVRAIIAGQDAIHGVLPAAVIVNVDPVCRAVAPLDRPDLEPEARWFTEVAVTEALDMLAGTRCPELGGRPDRLGVVGLNYYWTNQWELGSAETPLADDDPRRVPLQSLVRTAAERYGSPVMISETGHIGESRAAWVRTLAAETSDLLADGVPLHGVCLYPVLGMPAWHAQTEWLRMGLWDVQPGRVARRTTYEPMLAAVQEWSWRPSRT